MCTGPGWSGLGGRGVWAQGVLERDLKGLVETRADSREMLGLSLGGEDLSVHGQSRRDWLLSLHQGQWSQSGPEILPETPPWIIKKSLRTPKTMSFWVKSLHPVGA